MKFVLLFLAFFGLRDQLAQLYSLVLQALVGSLLEGAPSPLSDGCGLRLAIFFTLVFAGTATSGVHRLRALLAGLTVLAVVDLAGWFLWPQARLYQPPLGETALQQFFGLLWVALRDLLFPFLLWLVASDRHQKHNWSAQSPLYDLEARNRFSEG